MQIQNIYVTIFYWRKLFMHFYYLERIAMYFVVDFIIGRIYETWNTLLLMNKDCDALYFLVRMVKSFLFPVVNIMCALAEIILIKKHCFFSLEPLIYRRNCRSLHIFINIFLTPFYRCVFGNISVELSVREIVHRFFSNCRYIR